MGLTKISSVLCCVLLLVACSGDDEGSSDTSSSDMTAIDAQDDEVETEADSEAETEAGADEDPTPSRPEQPIPQCADGRLSAPLPATLDGSTVDGMDLFPSAPCAVDATGASADFTAFFVAPERGEYLFSSKGSDFDTVMHITESVDGSCEGDVLGCNDDAAMGKTSEIKLELEAEQAVLVIVDGYNQAEGAVQVSVSTTEQNCSDGVDNDNDGDADCGDIDCFLDCEDPSDWPAEWAQLEEDAVAAGNVARSQPQNCGGQAFDPAPPMTMNRFARYAARLHSRDMARRAFFAHDTPDGIGFAYRMEQTGFTGQPPWGENIAAGDRTGEGVIQSWIDSPGHCRNLMNPQYGVVGIGYAFLEGSPFGRYWTQNFGGSD